MFLSLNVYVFYSEVFMKQLRYALFLFSGMLYSQITVTSVERIPVPMSEHWSNALFSPNGQSIFLTNVELNGIWEYSLTKSILRQITGDKQSGFGFTLSSDGSSLGYRRTVKEQNAKEFRIQESVVIDLLTLRERVLDQGNSVDLPFFSGKNDAATKRSISSNTKFKSAAPAVMGTGDHGMMILKNGNTVVIDPFNGGQYIWPALSPDKKKITAVEMSRGAFICDLDGKNIVRIGRCNSPQWSADSKWVIGMNDVDDGHVIIGSDIIAVSVDGTKKINLTNSANVIELFPAVHPLLSEIVATTSAGDVVMIKFTEGK